MSREAIAWSEEQCRARTLFFQKKQNLYVTGKSGCGKTAIIREIVESYPDRSVIFVTASTGLAADLIEGTTLHSFASIGIGDNPAAHCAKFMKAEKRNQWKNAQVLVIDEISMIDADIFNLVNQVAKLVRKCNDPFGGVQLLISGDFLQLPPVGKKGVYNAKYVDPGDEASKHKNGPEFAFQSEAWKEANIQVVYMTKVFRQADPVFAQVLDRMRIGQNTKADIKLLEKCKENKLETTPGGIAPTQIFCLRAEVDQHNLRELFKLSPETHQVYDATDSGEIKHLDRSIWPKKLQLRVGAQVMHIMNDPEKGLVNGSRGVVKHFTTSEELGEKKYPVVLFENGLELTVFTQEHIIKCGKTVIATRRQLPLILAWALTVHKCQGMTLSRAVIHLGSAFEKGQHYVAISRVKSLDGLQLNGDVQWERVKPHPIALKFYDELEQSLQKQEEDSGDEFSQIRKKRKVKG